MVRLPFSHRFLAFAIAAGTVVGGSSAFADSKPNDILEPAEPSSVAGYNDDPLSLLGSARVDAAQLAAFVTPHNPRTTVPIAELANIYLQEGAAYGVRADLAWTQSIIETGFFHFPDSGMVHPGDNNFAGIGACDSCHNGHGYPDARTGVRAQMQLLRGYGDPNPPAGMMIYPPKSYRGSAPTWWQMGSGHWATSTQYAQSITTMYGNLLRFAGIDLMFSPPTPLLGTSLAVDSTPAPEPSLRTGDGMYLADTRGQVYDLGDTRFWGSAFDPSQPSNTVAIALTPKARGYWVFDATGSVRNFGDAPDFGSAPRGVVGVAAQPSGFGYWTLTERGAVRAYGNAADIAVVATRVNPKPVINDGHEARFVAITATRSGRGYWLLDSFGAVTAFGDAQAFGDATHATLDDPAIGIAATPWDDGYWIATASGVVEAFGLAKDHGGLAAEFSDDADRSAWPYQTQRDYIGVAQANTHLVVSLRSAPSGDGYWLVTADGLVVGRGEAGDFDPVDTQHSPVLAATSRMDTAAPLRPAAVDLRPAAVDLRPAAVDLR